MSNFKHDKRGFLTGEPVPKDGSGGGSGHDIFGTWTDIRNDVRSIARFLGARGGSSKAAQPAGRGSGASAAAASPASPSSRSRAASAQARDAATGRFVSSARAVAPKRTTRQEQRAAKPHTQAEASGKTVTQPRDVRGRFGPGAGGAGGGKGDGGGGAGDGGGEGGSGLGPAIADRLSGIKAALESVANNTENVDPAVAALHEVKDVVSPVGRGLFRFFGPSAEKKKERWYSRILAAIKGKKKPDDTEHGAVAGEGSGSLLGNAAKFMLPMLMAALPEILVAVVAAVGSYIAFNFGKKIGGAIYDWLDKSGIATKIFDAFDSLRDWIAGKVKAVKDVAHDFNSARELARAGIGGSAPVISPTSGRDLNDPRRLDSHPNGAAATVGGLIGSLQRGLDSQANNRTGADARALITARKYAAGNIAGLDDAHTRALVASTAATESQGGKLATVNPAGYMGRYQAGAAWLADAGLIRGGAAAVKAAMRADGFASEYAWGKSGGMTRFLKNDANWNNGLSYGKYLGSAQVQDAAFKTNSDKAYADLVRKGVITPGMSQEQIAGLLKARHIAGLGGAEAVAAGGTGPADANGTTARKYFEDLTSDRGGFLTAFSGPTATGGGMSVPQVSVPSSVPEKIPTAETVTVPPAAGAEKDKTVRAVMREPIGQDVGDRQIAHIVSGGIGG